MQEHTYLRCTARRCKRRTHCSTLQVVIAPNQLRPAQVSMVHRQAQLAKSSQLGRYT